MGSDAVDGAVYSVLLSPLMLLGMWVFYELMKVFTVVIKFMNHHEWMWLVMFVLFCLCVGVIGAILEESDEDTQRDDDSEYHNDRRVVEGNGDIMEVAFRESK